VVVDADDLQVVVDFKASQEVGFLGAAQEVLEADNSKSHRICFRREVQL
jgi:hypothetical protein